MKKNIKTLLSLLLVVIIAVMPIGVAVAGDVTVSTGGGGASAGGGSVSVDGTELGYLEIYSLKSEYNYGEPFEATLTYYLKDDDFVTISSDECEVYGFDSFVTNSQMQEVTIWYNGCSVNCTIKINCDDYISEGDNSDENYDNIHWTFEPGDGELYIDVRDEMPDFMDVPAPWDDFRHEIQTIIIDGDFPVLRSGTFENYHDVRTVAIIANVHEIRTDAFANCNSLRTVHLPVSIRIIEEEAFRHCFEIRNVYYDGTVSDALGVDMRDENIRNAEIHFADGGEDAYYFDVSVRTEYKYGEEFYADVYIHTYDGNVNPYYDWYVEGFDPYCEGWQSVIVICGNQSYQFEVYVSPNYDDTPDEPYPDEEYDDFSWSFAGSTGELVVSGNGDFPEFEDGVAPWNYLSEEIGIITICGNFDSIPEGAFAGCVNAMRVYILGDVRFIESGAFLGCGYLRLISLPATIEAIYENAFEPNGRKMIVHYEGTEALWNKVQFYDEYFTDARMYYNRTATVEIKCLRYEYTYGENVDAEITITYPDNTTEVSYSYETTWHSGDMYGEQLVTVSAYGCSETFTIFVKDADVPEPEKYIENVRFENVKTEYEYGEGFYVEVYVDYSDGTYELVEDFNVDGYDCYTVGDQTVTVSYGDYTMTFDVVVYDETTTLDYSFDDTTGEIVIWGSGEMPYFPTVAHVPWYPIHSDIKKVRITGNLTSVTYNAFTSCHNIVEVIIDAPIKTIARQSFTSCNSLLQIVLPATLDTIENQAFSGANSLKTVYYRGNATQWSDVNNLDSNISRSKIVYNYTDEPITSIIVKNVKTEYEYGEDFYAEVWVYDANGDSYWVEEYEVEGFDSFMPGMQTVTVRYGDYSQEFDVFVNEHIYIVDVKFLIESNFEYGESFHSRAEVHYSDGTYELVDIYEAEGFDAYSPGEQAVTIRYGEYSRTVIVYVDEYREPEPAYEVAIRNVKTEYEYGEEFYAEVWVRENGKTYKVDAYIVEGFDGYQPGKQSVTVRYGDYYETFIVTVYEHITVDPENAPKVTVLSERCKDGNTVDVVISLSNNTGFANLGLEIHYDETALTLVNVSENTAVGATVTKAQTLDIYPYNIGWDSISNMHFNGDLVTLTFEVQEGIMPGDYFVDVDFYKGRNGDYIDGISVNYDENERPLGLYYENGFISVFNYIPGDINGDGIVTNKDGTSMLRYLAGWDLNNIVEDALDTDGDGVVTNRDGTRLLRYLAGWDVEIN